MLRSSALRLGLLINEMFVLIKYLKGKLYFLFEFFSPFFFSFFLRADGQPREISSSNINPAEDPNETSLHEELRFHAYPR